MSSGAPVPVPAPPPRSLFGPLMLIAVGALFLMVNLGRVSPLSAIVVFARYWPAVIILWGVAKLLEHWQAQRAGVRAPGIGFGGVLLLILLILLGSGATAAYRRAPHVNWDGVREELADEKIGVLFGRRFEYSQSTEYAMPAGGTLRVVSERGSVRVIPSADDKVHVALRKSVLAHDEAEAAALAPRVVPDVTVAPDLLQIDGSRRPSWAGARLDMELRVPPRAAIDLTSRRGDVFVRGHAAPIRIDVSHGSVVLEDVVGNSRLQMHHADVDARNIRGDVVIDGRLSDAVLTDIDGAVHMRGDLFGDVRLDKVAKGIQWRSARTQLDLVRLDGEMRMGDGRLRLASVQGPLHLRTGSQDVDVDDVRGDVKIENRHGETEVRPAAAAPGNIEITNRQGPVRVTLPAAGGFQVDLRASEGEVKSDFELRHDEQKNETRASGVINDGRLRVGVTAERGSVWLRRQ